MAPVTDICSNYGIDSISGTVYNQSNTVIATGGPWACSAHTGTIYNIPPGSNLRIAIKGTVSGAVVWQGEKTGVTINAGQDTNVGTITMTYIGSDTTAPTVSSVTPSAATNVPITTAITAAFSESMSVSSISETTFTLKQGVTPVIGTVSYDTTSKAATFTPSVSLSYSTIYTATITTGAKDMAGNALINYTWSFTTEIAADTAAPSNTTAANFINSGASSTSSTTVTLAISATDSVGVTGYYASETSTTPTATAAGWTAVTSTTSYSNTTAAYTFTGVYTSGTTVYVYVWFKDAAGNTSTSVTDYIDLDTTAPNTSITIKPANPSNSTSASFSFTSTETGSSFQCQMDWGGYTACISPKSYAGLSDGSHTFDVMATDAAGNSDSTPESYTWTVDTVSPTVPTWLTATPISENRIDLSWTASTDSGGSGVSGYKIYRGGAYLGTSTTTTYSDTTVSAGTSYTYTVSAYDAAGNESAQSTSANATTQGTFITGGNITTDTTWTLANSPYIVTGSVIVNAGVTLSIEAGVIVKFDSLKSIQIDGALIARGQSANKITFTSAKSTPAAGDWGYILFSDTSIDATYDVGGNYTGGSILEYAVMEYAGSVGYNGIVRLDKAYPFINYCLIRNNSTSGIYGSVGLSGTLKITNNTISNNTTAYWGGGIYAVSEFGGTFGFIAISNNTIINNAAGSDGGGGIYVYSYDSNFSISKNIIQNNTINNNAGQYYGKGGGISAHSRDAATIMISDNIITGNTATSGSGVYATTWGNSSIIINNNIISDNTASWYGTGNGGGIVTDYSLYGGGTFTISNNSVCRNLASNESAVSFDTSAEFRYNTMTGNTTTGTSPTYTVYIANLPLFNFNNIFSNTATYELYNGNAQGTANVDATNNWWGTAVDSGVQAKIYDFVDDSTKGIVTYSPFATAIRTDAPISPPTGITATPGSAQIAVTWSANPESDTAGYKVYWGTTAGFPYANSADVGNATAYTIGSLPVGTYYVAVTAYDTTAASVTDDPNTIVNEKQTAGNESWYAVEQTATITSSSFAPKAVAEAGHAAPTKGESKTGCFIATAAYGSYLDPHVMVLREFRDNYLLTNAPGRTFVSVYYRVSPPIADFIREHEALRTATRWALTPVVYGVRYQGLALLALCIGVTAILRSRKV
ncbi:MAG: Ig-like domain-containing protein [Deltaproteobacteria bacterium]|nr:Ig-like domain-containing protein [Deltaproteobacteria bacterium]